MNKPLPTENKLSSLNFIDQWGFMLFALIGFAGIISAKALNFQPAMVAICACAAMMLYAFLVTRKSTGRMRADNAGDNCYYLGLIYTLASLSYAIATFRPEGSANEIVQSFGIALATTILGLILRVFLSQSRVDIEDSEGQARLELTEAVQRLRSTMIQSTTEMNEFTAGFRQTLDQMQASVTENLLSASEKATAVINSQAELLAKRNTASSKAFDGLIARVEGFAMQVETISSQIERVSQATEATQRAAETAAGTMDHMKHATESAHSMLAGVSHAVGQLRESAERVVVPATQFTDAVEAMQRETAARLSDIRSGTDPRIETVIGTLQQAANTMREQMSRMTEEQAQMSKSWQTLHASSLNAVQTHNDELSRELDKSRNLVTKVHGSLASMTDTLARTIESAP